MNRRWIILGILAFDLLWLVCAFALSYELRYARAHHDPTASYRLLILASVGTWIPVFRILRLDGFDGGCRLTAMAGRIAMATLLLMVSVLTISYSDQIYYPRLLLSYFGLLLPVGFMLIRIGVYWFFRSQHRRGITRKIVLVGNNRVTREFAFKIQRHPELLYEMVGTLHPVGDGAVPEEGFSSSGNLLSSIDVLETLQSYRVNELIVLEHTPGREFQTFVARCRERRIHVNVLPRGYELYTSKPKLVEIEGLPLISLDGPSRFPLLLAVKRVMDVALGLVLAVPAAVIIAAAGLVLLLKKGSVLRRETRVGKDGRAFVMYRLDVDRRSNAGPRYERLLHDLSISELPQLWNVFRGEMSLVGPRPESLDRVKHYSEWQRERLKAIPGMTGLAQVNGLREENDSEDKTRFDLQYLLEWTPFSDLALLLQTLGTLVDRCFGRRAAEVIEFPNPSNGAADADPTELDLSEVAHADRA